MKRIAKPSPVIRSTPRRHAERAHCSPEDPGPARKKLLFALLFIVLLAGTFAIQLLAHAESPSFRPAQRTFHRLPDRYAKSIQPFHSSCDRDRDGIDDQTDILQGALRYLSTNPRYQSRNYPTGYPDDACGICTDVIAFALRDARGIPYLLHHASSDQSNYEEDLLEERNDIIGHYRMTE